MHYLNILRCLTRYLKLLEGIHFQWNLIAQCHPLKSQQRLHSSWHFDISYYKYRFKPEKFNCSAVIPHVPNAITRSISVFKASGSLSANIRKVETYTQNSTSCNLNNKSRVICSLTTLSTTNSWERMDTAPNPEFPACYGKSKGALTVPRLKHHLLWRRFYWLQRLCKPFVYHSYRWIMWYVWNENNYILRVKL